MRQLLFLATLLVICSCSTQSETTSTETATYKSTESKYLRWVGDSKYDSLVDSPHFKTCYGDNQVNQYFNFSKGMLYKGEKPAIEAEVRAAYQSVETDESGWIHIRFVVNCNLETGRFRVTGTNENYEEYEFDEAITNQLLSITKKLNGWDFQPDSANARDYYQYLIYKIDNGQLTEIMP